MKKQLFILSFLFFLYGCVNDYEVCECTYSRPNPSTNGTSDMLVSLEYPCDFKRPKICEE